MAEESEMLDWIKKHVAEYKTNPEAAHMWDSAPFGGPGPVPTALLTMTGRKSGKSLTRPLIYSRQGDSFAIIASKGGSATHPVWFLNIQADPNVEIQVIREKYKGKARIATGAEREKIWADMAKTYPPYNDYQKLADKAGRQIPVVVIDRV
jgi:deazaflavin-dependent oxidoreductase (nitroreductase family)